jgi:hypothetical protein
MLELVIKNFSKSTPHNTYNGREMPYNNTFSMMLISRLAFLLGLPENQTLQTMLEKEAETHADIVQVLNHTNVLCIY